MKKPFIIAGPCSAESRRQVLDTCMALVGKVDMLRIGVWKPRSKPDSFEGVGARGLAWVAEAKQMTGLPAAVEVASPHHIESALKHGVDALWLGARTTVSPFAVQAIADALRGVDVKIMIKNPVNPDVDLWSGAVERFGAVGFESRNMILVHRGFSCYGRAKYRNAPMWNLAFEMRTRFPETAMLCDPSHMGGAREYVAEIAQTAADLRYDGLMIESHIHPSEAMSDASQQITPDELGLILSSLQWRDGRGNDPSFTRRLEDLRNEIDRIDTEIFALLSRRMDIAESIGHEKKSHDVAILQDKRWRSIVDNIGARAAALGLSSEFVRTILDAIHIESIERQNSAMNKVRSADND